MELKDKIVEVISKTLDVGKDEIKEDQKLYDSIGVDSTEMVELVVSLNKYFGINIKANEITKFSTINQIAEVIESRKQ